MYLKFIILLSSLITCVLVLLTGCVSKEDNRNETVKKNLPIPKMAIYYDDYFNNKTEDTNLEQSDIPPLAKRDESELTFAESFAQAALARTMHRVRYDGRYLKIDYPMGDVPKHIGVCTDVVIRSYRELGVDLQKDVHEDIKSNFSKYPSKKRWGLRKPDTNIDHRRVYNLQTFFERKGESLPISNDPRDYKPGDLVTWQVSPKLPHIGIVLELVSEKNSFRHLIAHNIGSGPVIDDILFEYPITGHYRYQPQLN